MGAPSVVMGLGLGQDRPQMPFAEDRHPVGDFGPGCEHEPFGIRVGCYLLNTPGLFPADDLTDNLILNGTPKRTSPARYYSPGLLPDG